ncbi:serine/threonine protein kinase [Deinobacterium chartae]|uniref:Serine/threonine protein kinase n=1 Tax=Deinobacterium chartae TaxID=521158 RepID=A0A841I0Y9_9DEIO|nr:serine/threonine-protein kinase [Deinobacterium chartae]MBB6098644.1 serine/threonine protein kinase [Deinobacterium chartae]
MPLQTSCPYCSSGLGGPETVCPACGAPLDDGLLPAGTRLRGGRYRLEGVLGRGGFGITYRAAQPALGSQVAIKELFPEGSRRQAGQVAPPAGLSASEWEAARRDFLEEGRVLERFNHHPGVVYTFDVFEENGTAYVVMQRLEGETLAARIAREGALEPLEVSRIATQLLGALEAVHAAGLLHRDLKPDNVFLSRGAGAVLIDFGSARGFLLGQVQAHTRLVTPGYAPPEQYATSAHFGPYTDLYALGATLYHALADRAPPAATDRLLGVALPPLPAAGPWPLRRAVERALSLRVDQRPQSAAEMRRWIDQPASRPGTPRSLPAPARGEGIDWNEVFFLEELRQLGRSLFTRAGWRSTGQALAEEGRRRWKDGTLLLLAVLVLLRLLGGLLLGG